MKNVVTKTNNSNSGTYWMNDSEDSIQPTKAVDELEYGHQRKVLWMQPIRLTRGNLNDTDWHSHGVAGEDDKAARTVAVVPTKVLDPVFGDRVDLWSLGTCLWLFCCFRIVDLEAII